MQALEPLTETEAKLVLETWEVVKSVGLEAAGVILFTRFAHRIQFAFKAFRPRGYLSRMCVRLCRLFETHPEVKPLFSFFKENSDISGDNPGVRKHALTVMETVNVAVEHIRNSTLGELTEDLFDVGVAHHTLQVNIAEQHFAVSVHARPQDPSLPTVRIHYTYNCWKCIDTVEGVY